MSNHFFFFCFARNVRVVGVFWRDGFWGDLSGRIKAHSIKGFLFPLPFCPSPFLIFFFFYLILSLSAYQHDSWLLILTISRVRLAPIVSIRLSWAINVTSDLSKGAQSPFVSCTPERWKAQQWWSPLGLKSHTGDGVLLETLDLSQ